MIHFGTEISGILHPDIDSLPTPTVRISLPINVIGEKRGIRGKGGLVEYRRGKGERKMGRSVTAWNSRLPLACNHIPMRNAAMTYTPKNLIPRVRFCCFLFTVEEGGKGGKGVEQRSVFGKRKEEIR